MSPSALPIDALLPSVRAALATHRAVVVRAAPGAGKSTRIPPAVADQGRVVVLQPRRIAARSLARRIAEEQGWTLGYEVGWHVRFERQAHADTRVLLVTEGMLTAYLADDPLLSDVSTLVFDEFHERSLHTDIGLTLARQAWLARDDLRVVVMSATLDTAPISRFLGSCPVIDVPGTLHPLTIHYAPDAELPQVVARAAAAQPGQILCFLPGASEIERTRVQLAAAVETHHLEIVPLHGSLSAEEQDRALQPSRARRVILATNIAETSLTVPDVSLVIDAGFQKVARYDAARAIDALMLERITQDSADQRAGRAARLGPGVVWRLWDARDRLRPSREPEIHRVDLAPVLLPLLAAGNRPGEIDWFDTPDPARVEAACRLLERLGALEGGSVSQLGQHLRRMPLHPRLARVLLAAGGRRDAARLCALLSEGVRPATDSAASTCDLLPWLDRWSHAASSHLRRVAVQLEHAARGLVDHSTETDADTLQRALLAGFPDRVAKQRDGSPTRYLLSTGRGAILSRDSRVVGQAWLVALDVAASPSGGAEAVIRLASAIDPAWLQPTLTEMRHWFDADLGTVKASRVALWDAIVMSEHPCAPDPDVRTQMLADEWLRTPMPEPARQWVQRLAFAGIAIDVSHLVRDAASQVATLSAIDLEPATPWTVKQRLSEVAPDVLSLPSGRTARLDYRPDGSVHAAVKLQELFGLGDTPRLGPRQTPVTFDLLAPNGRPVQTTSDLRSFWSSTYADVRKELRGRYPRHPWPEDPWTATPTHRTSPRR